MSDMQENNLKKILPLLAWLAWIAVFVNLLFLGGFDLYVNPALKPLAWFMFLFLAALGVVKFLPGAGEYKVPLKARHLVFLLPFILFFFTPAQTLGSKTVEKQISGEEVRDIKGGWYSFENEDITDWKALLGELKNSSRPEMAHILHFFPDESKKDLMKWNRGHNVKKELKEYVLGNLNRILEDKEFYNPDIFKEIKLGQAPASLLEKGLPKLDKKELNQLNRKLLEALFPREIKAREKKELKPLPDKTTSADYIAMSGPEYYRFWDMTQNKRGECLGKIFQVKGRYFKDKDNFLPNQAYLGRLIITCCAAHAIPAGIYLDFQKQPQIENNQWLKIKGRLELVKTKKGLLPVLRVMDYEKTKEESPYIYPVSGGQLPGLNLAGGAYKPGNADLLPIIILGFIILAFAVTVMGDE